MQGSKYEDLPGSFPTIQLLYGLFVDQAKIYNDPSFAFNLSTTPNQSQVEKTSKSYPKSAVTVRKTDVTAAVSAPQAGKAVKKDELDKQCPIQHKPHPLSKCRGLRGKHLDDTKTYLKEHSICLRCCGSTKHVAKDCKTMLKCMECE